MFTIFMRKLRLAMIYRRKYYKNSRNIPSKTVESITSAKNIHKYNES